MQKTTEQCMAEIKACSFLGIMVSIFVTGLAFIGNATTYQLIGYAISAWVIGFMFGVFCCASNNTPG